MAQNKNVALVTKNINKKGKLKGKNKKETKMLVGICAHHRFNKKGKMKPMIFPSAEGDTVMCPICKKEFKSSFYDDKEINNIVDELVELNNQNKFTAVATNSGDKMIDFFCQMGAMLTTYKKNAKKVRNIAAKSGELKKKKKNRTNEGSSKYGTWSINMNR